VIGSSGIHLNRSATSLRSSGTIIAAVDDYVPGQPNWLLVL